MRRLKSNLASALLIRNAIRLSHQKCQDLFPKTAIKTAKTDLRNLRIHFTRGISTVRYTIKADSGGGAMFLVYTYVIFRESSN